MYRGYILQVERQELPKILLHSVLSWTSILISSLVDPEPFLEFLMLVILPLSLLCLIWQVFA
jgi:hypothetical protein